MSSSPAEDLIPKRVARCFETLLHSLDLVCGWWCRKARWCLMGEPLRPWMRLRAGFAGCQKWGRRSGDFGVMREGDHDVTTGKRQNLRWRLRRRTNLPGHTLRIGFGRLKGFSYPFPVGQDPFQVGSLSAKWQRIHGEHLVH